MEILNTYTYNDSGWYALTAFSGVFIFILIICFVTNLIIERENWKSIVYFVGAIIASLTCIWSTHLAKTDDRIRHNAVVNDMSKFDVQKYKIVDQDEKLFTIEEIKQ